MTPRDAAGQNTVRWPVVLAGNISTNILAWVRALFVPTRAAARKADYAALFRRYKRPGLIVAALVLGAMILLDPFAGAIVRSLPVSVIAAFSDATDFGKSGWVLYPVGTLLLVVAALSSPGLDRLTNGVLAALVVRLGFIFVAIGLPGLIGTILKRLIGRMRPNVEEGAFAYVPFSWRPDYASFPSGHTITAFATLVAIGYLVPRARPLLWAFAITIGLSRVVVSAHFPSDVIAGAAFGAFGALLVREWFASRGLGFLIDKNGTVHAPPWLSLARAFRALRTALDRDFPYGWKGIAVRLPSFATGRRWLAHMTSAQFLSGAFQPKKAGCSGEPLVSVVVPVRNEAGNVEPLTEEIAVSLAARGRFELIYVDDGSTDDTAIEIDRLKEDRPWLRRVGHAVSCGQSAAICTGVAAARAGLVATLDGDGQNDPAFLPALIEKLEQDPRIGLVAGQRVGRQASGFKKMQSRIANGVRGAVLRDGTRDTGCGLKAFRRNVFLTLPYFDGLHRFLPALVRRDGYEIAYLDVVDRPRRAGKSNYGMWDRLWVGILDLGGVWWLIRRRRRVPEVVEVARNAG